MLRDIRLIEIEISNFCNRTCSFCPNSKKPRNNHHAIEFLDWASFARMILDLKRNEYKGAFSFSRYNEPFATAGHLAKYVNFIKMHMSNKIVTNTNGDYLNLRTYQLFDEVSIMDYNGIGAEAWKNKILKICPEAVFTEEENFIFTNFGDTKILVFLNFPENATIEDRGGIIDPIFNMKNDYAIRTRPCYEPRHFLGIDYNGEIMPCCNLRHDFHESYVLGDITKQGIMDIIDSSLRANFISDAERVSPRACKHCQKDPGRYTREEPGIEYKGERE